jgi:hypothetical protein
VVFVEVFQLAGLVDGHSSQCSPFQPPEAIE